MELRIIRMCSEHKNAKRCFEYRRFVNFRIIWHCFLASIMGSATLYTRHLGNWRTTVG